jgi:hypothetical protein
MNAMKDLVLQRSLRQHHWQLRLIELLLTLHHNQSAHSAHAGTACVRSCVPSDPPSQLALHGRCSASFSVKQSATDS